MLRAADVLLLNQRASVSDMSLPSKLASYFSSGRPVVAAVAPGSEAAAVVERAGAGVVISPGDPRALASALHTLRTRPETARALGRRGQAYAERHLTVEGALAGYNAFLEALTIVRNGR
jgi:glycosyltransferase involved in cell wall biosynthesis